MDHAYYYFNANHHNKFRIVHATDNHIMQELSPKSHIDAAL